MNELHEDEEVVVGASEGIQELLKDVEGIEVFIGSLVVRKVGFSVPRSARRFLSASRIRLGMPSLNEIKALSEIIAGHERSTPRHVKQAEGLEVDDVVRIAETYGASKNWWLIQIALIIAVIFVAIMRLGEVRPLKMEGVAMKIVQSWMD